MILRATFRNILSFKEETSISFVAGKGSLHSEQVVRADKRDDISVLRLGAVYGANAAGKSNFIKAIHFLQCLALGKAPVASMEAFKEPGGKRGISKIELEIKVKDKYYAYGVEFDPGSIREEWLFEINNRSEHLIFSRTTSDDGNTFDFANHAANENQETQLFLKFLGDGTPVNRTFLSEYVKRNGKGLNEIAEVRNWFAHELKIIFPHTRYAGLSVRAEKNSDFQASIAALLNHFNTGITAIRRVHVKSKEETGLPERILNSIEAKCKPGENVMLASASDNEVFFFERKKDGALAIFKQIAIHGKGKDETAYGMDEESDGTIRLLDFMPMLIDLQKNSVVYLIDEIDRSMHPIMTYEIIKTYLNRLNPDVASQMVFSTHECNLLDLELLRTDEVWFVEKDNEGASHFISLAEYKQRTDIKKGYLQGRYGAVPFFGYAGKLNYAEK